MGTWGVKIYQNDVSDDVRNFYKDQLRRGKTGEEITKQLIAENADVINDEDDAPNFWFALADTQWLLGRLEDQVKENALNLIENGAGVRQWIEEGHRLLAARKKAIEDLKERLLSPQPPLKKIKQYSLYKCQWKLGDVYAYPLDSPLAYETGIGGRFFLFHKMGETISHPGHIIPTVRVKITKDDILPKTREEFDALEYVQFAASDPYNSTGIYIDGKPVGGCVRNEYGEIPEYVIELLNTSKRAIPKSLTYVGNFVDVKCPAIEYIEPHGWHTGAYWKSFERVLFHRYVIFNAR